MTGQYLLHLTGTDADRDGARAALALKAKTKAHLEALFVGPDPADIVPFFGEGVPGSVVDELIKTANETADASFKASTKIVEEEAAKAGLKIGEDVPVRQVRGPAIEVVTRAVRLIDLSIFPYTTENMAWGVQSRIEHVLLDTRRPVLVVRGKVSDALPGKVVILWDGKIESATAVLRAHDLLSQASEVKVLHLKHSDKDVVSADEIVTHLGHCGIKATGEDVGPVHSPTGEALLETVTPHAPDLVVMGGYGHSRLRQLVLGGATRHFLAEGPCPVFLAH